MADVRIDEGELRRLLDERAHLREQVTSLQQSNTGYLERARAAEDKLRTFARVHRGDTPDDDVCGEGDGECLLCGVLDCPHGEPLHYHHDGCPACAESGEAG